MCIKQIILLLCIFWGGIINSFALESLNSDSSSNIIRYYNDLNLKFIINTKYNSFVIENENLPNEIHWRTNDNNNIGLGANYKWFGLNLLFNIPGINNDDEVFGKTSSFNLIANAYTNRIGLDVFIQDTKGFYLENPGTWNPGWKLEQNFPKNASLNIQSIGANFLYIYNPEDFSFRSSFILNERQVKSAGSMILGSYFNVIAINTDSSFIPFSPDIASEYSLDVRDAEYVNLGGFIGYSHNFILKKYFFISLTGAIGVALQGSNIIVQNELYNNVDKQNLNSKFHMRAVLGYSNDNYFGSLALIADNNGLGKSLNYNFGIARLTFGYRLKFKKKKA